MASDQSGTRWAQLPLFGAVGAGRRDELPTPPAGFGLTPSGEAEQETARQIAGIMGVPEDLLGLEAPADAEP